MKCPVCDKENKSLLCSECGFDGSADYGKYPSFCDVGWMPSASALRLQRQEQPVEPIPVRPSVPEPPRRRGKVLRMLIAASLLVILGLCIWIGTDFGEKRDPGAAVQLPEPPETTGEGYHYGEGEQTVVVIGPWTNHTLRSDEVPNDTASNGYTVLGSEYLRTQIKSVTFLDTLAATPDDAWNISDTGTGKVFAWAEPNGGLYDLYIAAEGGVWGSRSCKQLFSGYLNLERITFGDAFHTDLVKDMSYMFEHCHSLTELDLSSFVTSNVADMSEMFLYCIRLTELDLTGFDTSGVTGMGLMFYNCESLTELNLGDRFVTTNANTEDMFADCPAGADYAHLVN